MNHVYRLIWNEAIGAWVVVSEITKACGRRSRSGRRLAKAMGLAALALSLTLAGSPAYANPEGGQVVAGSATLNTAPNLLTVNQASDKAIITWQGFSIGAAEQTRFVQPSSSSVTLNRVTGGNPSEILGRLTANGNIFLVNPNGVVFGTNARVDVNSLVATTHDIRNEDFLAGNYRFTIPGKPAAMILNQGTITAAEAGLVALVAPAVRNDGVIVAHLGKVTLAAGTGFTLDLYGDRLVELEVDPVTLKALTLDGQPVSSLIENTGSIEAGTVFLTANAAREVVDNVINMSGIITARSARQEGGTIILEGGEGGVTVSGTLDASAAPDAAGSAAGGEILVLGDSVTLESTAKLLANGAEAGGDGGFIETSGHTVTIRDGAQVSTIASNGSTGTWLIDPNDFTIAASGGNMTGAAVSYALTTTDFEVRTDTMGTAGGNGDIFVNDAVAWSANNLMLTAERNIEINAVLDATGTAGLMMSTGNGGAVNVGFNQDGSFAGKVNLAGTTSLTINNSVYTIINDLGAVGGAAGLGLQGMNGDLGGYYALGSDIDASATSGWESGAGFLPVGNAATKFTGTFDGLGHTITGLTINRPATSYIGLFGYTNNATIQNVGLEGVSVTGASATGGLVGYNAGTISNSYASGMVAGIGWGIGGLVGRNAGDISDSHAEATVSSGVDSVAIGGLAGDNIRGSILDSYASGNVTAGIDSDAIGGLVGFSEIGTIDNSYATGNVSDGGNSWGIGGLVGHNFNSSVISNSYASGMVSGGAASSHIGGLVGLNNSNATIRWSYSTGAVTGSIGIGGLVGYRDSTDTVTVSYWNTETSGLSTGVGSGSTTGVAGLTPAQMQDSGNFAGWNFNTVWNIDAGSSYPYLRTNEQATHPAPEPTPDPVPEPTPETEPLSAEVVDPAPAVLTEAPPVESPSLSAVDLVTVAPGPEADGPASLMLDTQPPSAGEGSGLPLPDSDETGLIKALDKLVTEEYTPEERTNFYAGLSKAQVYEGLRNEGYDGLAAFMAETAAGGKTSEAGLMVLLEAQQAAMLQGGGSGLFWGATAGRKQQVAMLGVFDRMRHLAMTDLLGAALNELRQNPDAADMVDEGQAGGPIRVVVPPRAETGNGLVEITGRVESESKMLNLRVNGRWAYVEEEGLFRVQLPMPVGEQAVLLETNDPSGSRARAEVRVTSTSDGTRNPGFTRKPEGRKVALLIAVEEYDSAIPELVTPVRDARAIGQELAAGYGFETKLLANPSKDEVLAAMRGLAAELSEHDSLTVFYAGHGYLMEDTGRGYWLPRDAETSSPKNWISNRDVARLFHRTRAKQIMMVSDSCYSGAFTKEGAGTEVGGGPARDLRAVMALSSGGEQPVWDGGGEGHSVFAAKMISALGRGEAEAGLKLYRTVRAEVVKASPQVPGYGAMISAGYDQGADYVLR